MRRFQPSARKRDTRALDMSGRWAVARLVAQFTFVGLAALVVVGLATEVASRRVGEREAISDARTTTLVKAQGLVEPVITEGLLTADPAAVARVATVVEKGVLDRSLVRVKIWTREGLIVYSDEPRLAGTAYQLGADEITAIDHGVIEAEVSDLSRPENRFERAQGKLLEVYLPVRTPSGQRLLFEAYFRYDAVTAAGRHIWRSFAPISLGALVALELVQIPLAWALARRLRERQREREMLLQQAIEISDVERRRIAGDLHDGVVQDLAGVAYSLVASSRREELTTGTATLLGDSAAQVRDSIKSLRTLLLDIYPPKLADAGLESALTDLLVGVNNRGTAATLETDGPVESLPESVAALLYRAAQEAVRNVLTHAHAGSVTVRVAVDADTATLDVTDDGTGFDPAVAEARARAGHFGLRALTDRVTAAGGSVQVRSTQGEGTHLEVRVPLQ
ncbi:MAG: two-component system, NarL family, sensor kinase [Actinomycetota bacterium]|nr:two-component system, NarL family, sensor kinase [Actinomycetota bacterium]